MVTPEARAVPALTLRAERQVSGGSGVGEGWRICSASAPSCSRRKSEAFPVEQLGGFPVIPKGSCKGGRPIVIFPARLWHAGLRGSPPGPPAIFSCTYPMARYARRKNRRCGRRAACGSIPRHDHGQFVSRFRLQRDHGEDPPDLLEAPDRAPEGRLLGRVPGGVEPTGASRGPGGERVAGSGTVVVLPSSS